MVAYEIAMGFALVCVLLVSQSLNLGDIVNAQARGTFADKGLNFLSWNWLPLFPMFLVYFISAVAETNRAPFDVAGGESGVVAGFPLGDSGGWLPPLDSPFFNAIPGIFWLVFKISALLLAFLWFRATFPRYRYDQIMRLGWKVFLPLTIVWLVLIAAWMQTPWNPWR